MRIWIPALVLIGCSSSGNSLDDFEHAKEFVSPTCFRKQIEKTRLTCSPLVGAAEDCRCEAKLELEASPDGKKLVAVRYSVQHCPEDRATTASAYAVSGYRATELARIFDLKQNAGERDPSTQRMTGTYVDGNATMNLEWTREAYRDDSGNIEPNGRVSYFVVIKPRKDGDRESVKIENEPTVTPRKKCPLD